MNDPTLDTLTRRLDRLEREKPRKATMAVMERPMNAAKTKMSWFAAGFVFLVLWPLAASAQGTAWEKYMAAGAKAYQQGQYAEAEKSLQAALEEAERFGSEDPRLATSLNGLALLYKIQGQYDQAEPLYQRSLAIREKALGPDHPVVALSLENYAALLRKTNRATEAAEMEARAKEIRAKHAQEKQ